MSKKPVIASLMIVLYAALLALTGCGHSSSSTPDTTAPTVVSVTPAASSTTIATGGVITVTFSEAVDTSTISGATFIVKDSGNNAVSGTVSSSGTTATFTPSASLSYLTPYTATITTGAKDAAGNALAADYTWTFTTVTTPSPLLDPAVLKSWIDNGALNSTGSNRVVILDVNSAATYTPGHIPGALLADSSLYMNRQEGPAVDVNMVLDGASMDAFVQKYGIDNNTTIVFTANSMSSATSFTRAYWMFRYWGFPKEKLKVLDGVNALWKTTYPSSISTGISPTVTASTYSVKSNASLRADLRASLSEMISVASGSVANAVILDARTASTSGSYAGIAGSTAGVFAPSTPTDYVVFDGHMNGAVALNYTTMYTTQFLSSTDLTTMFATVGIDSTKTTYAHCRTGVIASVPFFVLDAILGWPVVNYDGSWSQWGQMSGDFANGGRLAADSPWRTDIPSLSSLIVYNHATKPVELLTLNGSLCSGQTSTTGTITETSAGCTTAPANVPESYATSGNQIETADAAYMVP